MKTRRTIVLLFLTVIVLGAFAPTASAHKTAYTPDGKVKFAYGLIGEPAYTYYKTGLDLGISNNQTGAPYTGLEAVDHDGNLAPKLYVSLLYSGQELNMTNGFKAQHGKTGWYTYPLVLTKPGVYQLKIRGTINGTVVNQVIEPAHAIEALDVIMWPEKASLPADQQTQLTNLQQEVNSLKTQLEAQKTAAGTGKGNAPALDAAIISLALLGTVALLRRRTA